MITDDIKVELEQLAVSGRIREFLPVDGRQGTTLQLRGKSLTDFTSWDLLGVGSAPSVKRAAQVEIERDGISPRSSRTVSGNTPRHTSCERRLASFLGSESALLFPTRTHAILSIVTAIAGERDVFLIDELLQSPISDAAYLVNASVEPFADLSALEALLEKHRYARRRFIVLETLSPLTGNLTDLAPFVALSRRFDASVIVDDSYALGIVGPRGAGGVEVLAGKGREPLIHTIFAAFTDLSLGLGVSGAAIVASRSVIQLIASRSASISNDTPLPSFLAAAIEASIDFVELKPLDRERAYSLAARVKRALPPTALATHVADNSPIVSLAFKKLRTAQEVCEALFQRGILAEALPVPRPLAEGAVVRLLISSFHTEGQIDELLRALSEIYSRVELPSR